MSMYGLLFGRNSLSTLILAMLNLTEGDVGRFRDVFISEGKIAVYTRNGGGNRECWNEGEKEDCHCPGCVITHYLPKHPNYLYDKDDDFDCTYATIYFSFPEQYKVILEAMDAGKFNPDKRWVEKLKEIEASSKDDLKAKYPQIVALVEEIAKKLST